MVKTEAFEEGEIPGIRAHHAQTTVLGIAEIEGQSGESAHEGGIHQLALFQVEDELGVAFGNHDPGKFLQTMAIFESPATFYFDPDRPVRVTDENTRCLAHNLMINPKNTMLAKSTG